MLKPKQDFINKIHLIISVCIVIPTAFIYGLKPELSFDMFLETIDKHNFYKAIMGLYLGFSTLWVLVFIKLNNKWSVFHFKLKILYNNNEKMI